MITKTRSSIMSDLEQGQRLGAAPCGDVGGTAGAEDTPSPVDSRISFSGLNNTSRSEHAGRILGDTSLRSAGSFAEASIENSSTTSRQAHLVFTTAQLDAQLNSNDTQLPQGPPDHSAELEHMGGQPLLPEDDGMGAMRIRIHAIRDLGYSNTDQARMIHDLMTENYHSSRAISGNHLSPVSSPALSSQTSGRTQTPNNRWSGQSFGQSSVSSTSTATFAQQEVCYNLSAEDLKPTFHPKSQSEPPAYGTEGADVEEVEEPCLGCPHYKRNVKPQCYDCKKWYPCRFCHDEVEDHHLDRPKTENMLCMLCGHAQPAAQYCRHCGEIAAQYYCDTCKLWDNDASKSIYHCSDCGICRIGKGIGRDFFHCKTCSLCLPISIETTHKCIERSTQCDCPICGDYMFTSPETVVFMRCGHTIHQRCLTEYSKTSYRCPICSKTITNMEATFRNLDRTIQGQPMPADFKDTKALITCNDCGSKSVVKYHWLGLRCDMCESYNTTQLRILQGDSLDLSEQAEAQSFQVSRLRSSSHSADDTLLPTLTSLQSDPSSAPGAGAHHLNSLSSLNTSGQFSSYNLTRGRAISPVISNYFGIPPDRQSQRSTSTSFFGNRTTQADENDEDGEVNIWGTRFRYRYGFLSRGTDPGDDDSAADNDEADDQLSVSSDSDDRNNDEEEDEDDGESIDIFGHR